MSWYVKYNQYIEIIEVVLFGYVTGEDLRKAALERIRLQEQFGKIHVLADASRIERLVAGVYEVHDLPAQLYDNAKATRAACLALLLPGPKDAREKANHYATACTNRGWHVQLFDNRLKAVEWLQKMQFPQKSD